nr:MAG TPA: hypothetical protein [Caudoviricetes sp.]
MPTFDPLAELDGVQTYQEGVMVRAVRLTRDNATMFSKIARKTVSCSDYGVIFLTGPCVRLKQDGDRLPRLVLAPGRADQRGGPRR